MLGSILRGGPIECAWEEILTGVLEQLPHRLCHVVVGATDLGAGRQANSVPHAGERHMSALQHSSYRGGPAAGLDRDGGRVALTGSIGARTAAVRASFRLPTPAARMTASA